jgi:hypothetical protein
MPIPSENFNAVIFLSELGLQCQLFERSIKKLEIGAEHWINISKCIDDGATFSPLEIIAECTICLSAMSAIRRIIFPKGKSKPRGETLYNLLNKPILKYVRSTNVRNSWEHHDERLENILSRRVIGSAFSEIHVHPNAPKENETVLRRFDPLTLSIHFTGDIVELKPCITEIQHLKKEINEAFARLQLEIVKV